MERVLVTGNLGYIGFILTEDLLKEGYKVIGLDTNFYRDKLLFDFEFENDFLQLNKDLRNVELEDLKGIDSIIHLAALSNDPLSELNPKLTEDINFKSSFRIAKLAKKAGIKKFLFSSSCSIYGQTGNKKLNENDPLNPISLYAKTKIKLEHSLSQLADSEFSPVFLRNGTAYGVSPNMRFDLVVNNLTGWAYTTGEIKILSDGRAWRPIVHVRDIANAFIACLKAPREKIHNQAFNVGVKSENYQVKEMAEVIHNEMKSCEIKVLGKFNPDQRTYIVNFDKIYENLKNYNPKWNIKKGVRELLNVFEKVDLTKELFENKNFTRLRQLKYLLETNQVQKNLFWN
jgi:nucleoside-diphosphate-sugar epimerase